MTEFQQDAKRIARILRDGDYHPDESDHLYTVARRQADMEVSEGSSDSSERLTWKEREKFIEAVYDTRGRRGLMLRTLLEGMLQVSELVSLDADHLSLPENLIVVPGGDDGRGRDVPILSSIAHQLKLHLAGRDEGPLFRDPWDGMRCAEQGIHDLIHDTASDAGIQKRVHLRQLHFRMAARLIEAGMPAPRVRMALGLGANLRF